MTTEPLITLEQAAALIPGATAGTLKRRARQGKLVTYRPGKAYLTTAADVLRMVELCRVAPSAYRERGAAAPDAIVARAAAKRTLERLRNS